MPIKRTLLKRTLWTGVGIMVGIVCDRSQQAGPAACLSRLFKIERITTTMTNHNHHIIDTT